MSGSLSGTYAMAGDVWQEADGVLLLCVQPGAIWRDFNGADVPWDALTIARPLRRLLDPRGNLVAAPVPPVPDVREAVAAALLASWAAADMVHPQFDSDRADALRDADAVLAIPAIATALGSGVVTDTATEGK